MGEQLGNAISQQMINLLRTQNPGAPAKMFDILKDATAKFVNEFMNSPELAEGITQAYAKYFAQDEIKHLMQRFAAERLPIPK